MKEPSLILLLAEEAQARFSSSKFEKLPMDYNTLRDRSSDIAIIGASLRFPGANSLQDYWDNIQNGREVVRDIDPEAAMEMEGLHSAGDQKFISANTRLKNPTHFDAHFFDIGRREAELMDPQRRIFIECAWEALENAGYDPGQYRGLIGMYAGIYANYYLLSNVLPTLSQKDAVSEIQTMIMNEKDHLTTYAAYKLNLRGPIATIQTACSTSLVAVHMACESLLTYSSDMVVAGGATISFPQILGYYFQQGGLLSEDGHCRTFDAQASGTIYSDGVGVIVLKRYFDAIENGDHIYGVINGTAMNNDGAARIGYTAPGVNGQVEVISRAQKVAEVHPEEISYIEAHGTGTPLGDRIELEALHEVFNYQTQKKAFCALGSVKANIGHLGPAAGISGLIKTMLALQHKKLPPQINFEEANDKLGLQDSPFYVNTFLSDWEQGQGTRKAGVSSFGLGGTNVHVIMEEPPDIESDTSDRDHKVLVLTAKTAEGLQTQKKNMITYLEDHPGVNMADLAYTLQVGRRTFEHRLYFTFRDGDEAHQKLMGNIPGEGYKAFGKKSLLFTLTDDCDADFALIRALYESEPMFKKHLDQCTGSLGIDLPFTLAQVSRMENGEESLQKPLALAAQVSLARTWIDLGMGPGLLVGNGLGFIAAAVVANVFDLKAVLKGLQKGSQGSVLAWLTGTPPSYDLYIPSTGQTLSRDTRIEDVPWHNLDLTPTHLPHLAPVLDPENQIMLGISLDEAAHRLAKEKPGKNEVIYASSLFNSNSVGTVEQFYQCLGQLWFEGCLVNWKNYYEGEKRVRMPLPTYPFSRTEYCITPSPKTQLHKDEEEKKDDVSYTHLTGEQLNQYVAPENETEIHMVTIWEEELGIKPIGIKDSFFESGGNSLLGVRVHERICKELNVTIELKEFFESQTIENVSKLLIQQAETA